MLRAERTRLRRLARDHLDDGTVSGVTCSFEHVAIEFLGVCEEQRGQLLSEAVERHRQLGVLRATSPATHLVWGVGLEKQGTSRLE